MGGCLARDAGMGEGTYECDRDHGFPRGNGSRRDSLGTIAATAGVKSSLLVQAALILLVLAITNLLGNPWSIDFTMTADLNAVPATVMNVGYKLLYRPQPSDGPVLVTEEFELDRSVGAKFVELMREVRLVYLRNGAYSWQLFEDPTRHNTFRMEMMVPSWTQYRLQQDRMTKADREVIEQAESLPWVQIRRKSGCILGSIRNSFPTSTKSQRGLRYPKGTSENARTGVQAPDKKVSNREGHVLAYDSAEKPKFLKVMIGRSR
ncbi:MAG TPA: MFS transporter [Chthoniobacterales bacterium]|nr:MFS transporter [Chthoniobacterales bacterium]